MTITKRDLEEAPMFTVFRGTAEEVELGNITHEWDLCGISGGTVADEAVLTEARKRGIQVVLDESGDFIEPQADSEYHTRLTEKKAGDDDACLAYLKTGGMIAKLPDKIGSQYFRWYVIARARKTEVPSVQKVVDEFLEEEMDDVEGTGKEVQVTVHLAGLTRMVWSEQVTVPADTSHELLNDLVRHLYDEVDCSEYEDDADYWERGVCDWERVK